MCTVQNGELVPHRKAAEDMYGAERQISTAQRSCRRYIRCRKTERQKDRKTERRKEKKTNNKHHTEFRKEKV